MQKNVASEERSKYRRWLCTSRSCDFNVRERYFDEHPRFAEGICPRGDCQCPVELVESDIQPEPISVETMHNIPLR